MNTTGQPTLKNDMKADIQRAGRRIEAEADEAENTIRDYAQHAGKKVRTFIDDTSQQASEIRRTTEERIANNPMKAIAISGLVGIVLGALIRR